MSAYQPKVNPKIYGLHIRYDKGYDAHSQRNYPAAEGNSASGYFKRADGTQIDLWITEVSADFTVSGQTAQSRMLREFFPRNLEDITLKISGNVSSTQEYNRLAAFVRETNWSALQVINQGGKATSTLTFGLYDSPGNNGAKPFGHLKRNTKGSHRPWLVNGYIKDMAAGAVRHEVAPAFSVQFIVTESMMSGNTGIWGDANAVVSQLRSFLQIVSAQEKVYHGTGFTQDPVTAVLSKRSPVTDPGAQQRGVWSQKARTLRSLGM